MARQDETRQYRKKTRQNKKRQHRTRQDNTTQHNTAQHNTTQHNTTQAQDNHQAQDRTSQDKTTTSTRQPQAKDNHRHKTTPGTRKSQDNHKTTSRQPQDNCSNHKTRHGNDTNTVVDFEAFEAIWPVWVSLSSDGRFLVAAQSLGIRSSIRKPDKSFLYQTKTWTQI